MSEWIKSSFCDNGASCLEVGRNATGDVLVRSSTTMKPVEFRWYEWPGFLAEILRGEPSWAWFRGQDDIEYSQEEAAVFQLGVMAGEFDYDKIPRIDKD
jgi:hypothetical protein